jgi:two-component system OmpR family response regulator
MRVLVVEDDPALLKRLKADLAEAGYAVDGAANGQTAEILGDQFPYDVIVLDLGLPGRAGLDVLKNWRRRGNKTPVIILTARGQWNEKVEGFSAGADDYMGKPFHMAELVARIGAVLRRAHGRPAGPLVAGAVSLDEDTQEVRLKDQTHRLTGVEFRLLRYLMLHPGHVLSKAKLTDHVYDLDADQESNVIEVYINRLRQKLGKEAIKTRRGQGYVFEPPPA